MPYVLYGIILIALIILVRNIRIVPQAQAYVITRLGAYKTTWGVGLHLKIPFIESVAKRLSLKEQVADFPPQPVITKDNVTMQIDILQNLSSRISRQIITKQLLSNPIHSLPSFSEPLSQIP